MSMIIMTRIRSLRRNLFLKFLALLFIGTFANSAHVKAAVDTMRLTDEPGNWFRSDATRTPLTIINPGDSVDFVIDAAHTNTRHTVTLVIKPVNSQISMDQDKPQSGKLSLTFDVPGVYVLLCKVHPYMTAVVAVKDLTIDPAVNPLQIPDVTSASLPFIERLLGMPGSLPATTVLSVITTVAPLDSDPDGLFGKKEKWDILSAGDPILVPPPVPGVGEIWVNTQFERVPGQTDKKGVLKPGTITVLDANSFTIEKEINGLAAEGLWNNPHNMWVNFALDVIYNGNWFGKWINKIDRVSGNIMDSIEVGEAPTHIINIPPILDPVQAGVLTIPLSAENNIVKVEDRPDGLAIIDEFPTGAGRNHPHGHWLNCGNGARVTSPNVFKGLGFEGSISVIDTLSGIVIKEFTTADDPNLIMPIAAGECHVEFDIDNDGENELVNKSYVSNVVTGVVTVIDVEGDSDSSTPQIITDIPVTLTPTNGLTGSDIFSTLQVPIQTPVSPNGKWVATAVFSLTSVPRPLPTGGASADHVAIIDARTDQVVKWLATPAGTHGVNWGIKKGGGYYAYVTSQHANVLTVIDPDPNGDDNGSDAQVVGTILLANNSTGADATDGTGGQGIKLLPNPHDGWVQPTVELVEQDLANGLEGDAGAVTGEVESWINQLTESQKNPCGCGCSGISSSCNQSSNTCSCSL